MSVVKPKYGTPTAMTITLASLADTNARESAAVDNTANLFQDAHVVLTAKLATGSPADKQAINIYAAGSEDGTNWGDNATGADAALTMRSFSNLQLIGQVTTTASGALTYRSHPLSVAAAFGGVLPPFWSIVIENLTGLAFDPTTVSLTYTGINLQVV